MTSPDPRQPNKRLLQTRKTWVGRALRLRSACWSRSRIANPLGRTEKMPLGEVGREPERSRNPFCSGYLVFDRPITATTAISAVTLPVVMNMSGIRSRAIRSPTPSTGRLRAT